MNCFCCHGSAKCRILQEGMHYRSQQPPASQSRQKHHQDQTLGSLRPQCTLLVKCFSFLFSDTRRPLKLHNGGDHQHTRSQRSRMHHSTLPFEPHELQQLFLPNSWACRNPLLKADHVLEHGSHLKAGKSAPTTPALALLSASTTSRIAG